MFCGVLDLVIYSIVNGSLIKDFSMKVLTVVLAICMLSIIGCSNDNDARVQELEQAQAVPQTATPTLTAGFEKLLGIRSLSINRPPR